MSLHPALLLAVWIAFACALPWLDPDRLLVSTVLLAPLVFQRDIRIAFARLLRRTRLLLLVMVTLYGFLTPGASLLPEWSAAPSVEGLNNGAIQAWRLLLVLLSLSAILSVMGRTRLLAGLYGLLMPFKLLGMPVERFVVRLALTMQMAQEQGPMRLTPAAMALAVNRALPRETETVDIELPPLHWRDGLFGLMAVLVLGGLLW